MPAAAASRKQERVWDGQASGSWRAGHRVKARGTYRKGLSFTTMEPAANHFHRMSVRPISTALCQGSDKGRGCCDAASVHACGETPFYLRVVVPRWTGDPQQ